MSILNNEFLLIHTPSHFSWLLNSMNEGHSINELEIFKVSNCSQEVCKSTAELHKTYICNFSDLLKL